MPVKEGLYLLDEFEKYVAENELFTHDDKILLTVSGGVDSMVLMSLAAAAGYRFGVAHRDKALLQSELYLIWQTQQTHIV